MSYSRRSTSRTIRRVVAAAATAALTAGGLTLLPATAAMAADMVGGPAPIGSGTDGQVWAVAASDTHMYAVGNFTTVDSVSASKIAQYDIATQTWSPMGTFAVAPDVVIADADGNLIAGGNFGNADGVPDTYAIAKWDGSAWSSFGDSSQTLGGGVYAMAVGPTGTLYIAGTFSMAGSTGLNYVAKWTGSAWQPLGTGLDTYARSIAVDSQDNVYVAGDFTTAGGRPASHIAKWDSIASTWSALGSGLEGFSSVNVDIAVDHNDHLYAVGHFDTAGGITVNNAAQWDGTQWSAMAGGIEDIPFNIAVDSANQVYVTGSFATARATGGTVVPHTTYIARWNGTSWEGVSPGLNGGSISALGIGGPYGTVYIGGTFIETNPGAVALNSLAQIQPGPTISHVSATRVSTAGGTPITINGAALTSAAGTVTIDGVTPDNVTVVNQGEITLDTKAHSAGDVTLAVTTGVGSDTQTITYVAPPTVSSVSPGAGPVSGGGTLTITGSSFTDATSVQIGGNTASNLTVVSDTEITVTIPAHAADLSDVKVVSGFGEDTLANGYRYAASPDIASISPTSGTYLGGTTVTISGLNFTGATEVNFGASAATSFSVVNDTTITAVAPAGVGTDISIFVTTPGGSDTAASAWAYITQASAPRSLAQTGKAKGSMTFSWLAPTSTGGSSIVGYRVQYRKHGTSSWTTRSGLVSGLSVTLSGLVDGTNYDVRIAASTIFDGVYASTSATTPAVPAAPTRVSARVRGNTVTMRWTRAAIQTGSSRTANLIKCVKGSTKKKVRLSSSARSGSITLGRGTWVCKVYAYTEAGHGPGSTGVTVKVK